MIKNVFKYILVIATVAAFASCSVDEIDNVGLKETVKFVVKPTNYISSIVSANSTKATSDIFENKIVNIHFLLFNQAGNRMYYKTIEDVTDNTDLSQELDLDMQEGKVTACFIANVPTSTVSGYSTLYQVKEAVLNLEYYSGKVTDADNKENFFVVPEFDLKGNGEIEQCIPMLGMTECTLGSSTTFEISLKRLFAKVSMNIGVGDISLDNLTQSFDILAVHLLNLPTKVKLTEPTAESAWVKEVSSFLQTQIEGPIDGDNISSTTGSSYDFYFYVPEYYLYSTDDKSGNYGNQKFKPNMYDKTKYPILIRLFGKYKGSSTATEQGVTYDLYLGENASASFTLRRNKHYKNYIKIKGITNSINGTTETTTDVRVVVDELDEVEILGQTANCYIIGRTGSYLYPAYKGVWKRNWSDNGLPPSKYFCTKGTRLRILDQDNSNIKLANLEFNKETCEISFDVTSFSDDGNLVLGLVYDENGTEKIEWSWHLWFVDGAILGYEAFDIDTDTYPNGKIMMDRNLGAKVSTGQNILDRPGAANGLYYKYGDKKPYMNGKYLGGGEPTQSIGYNWQTANSSKSQTDPCPPGYRVSLSTVWESNNTKPVLNYSSILNNFEFWDGVYLPTSGFIDEGGTKVDDVYSNTETKTYSFNSITQELLTYQYNANGGRVSTPRKFIKVSYKEDTYKAVGCVWGIDKALEYHYDSFERSITSLTYVTGTWKKVPIIGTYYISWNSSPQSTMSPNDLKKLSGGSTTYTAIETAFKTGLAISDWGGTSTDYDIINIPTKSYGYQVRCMKE